MARLYYNRGGTASGTPVAVSGAIIEISGDVVQVSGQIVQISGQTVVTQFESVNTTVFTDILKELKKINIQLAIITDNEIKNIDVEV